MSDRIAGQVARVTSDRELIINRGAEHGVKVGMNFAIKGPPVEVTDPETNEPIGSVAPVKVVVQVADVDEKFCIARTFRTRSVLVRAAQEAGPMYNGLVGVGRLDSYLQPPRPAEYETLVETLRVNPDAVGVPIAEEESAVQVGDIAESLAKGDDVNPATMTLFR